MDWKTCSFATKLKRKQGKPWPECLLQLICKKSVLKSQTAQTFLLGPFIQIFKIWSIEAINI